MVMGKENLGHGACVLYSSFLLIYLLCQIDEYFLTRLFRIEKEGRAERGIFFSDFLLIPMFIPSAFTFHSPAHPIPHRKPLLSQPKNTRLISFPRPPFPFLTCIDLFFSSLNHLINFLFWKQAC